MTTTFHLRAAGQSSSKRYQWSPDSRRVWHAPTGWIIDPPRREIGQARCLEDAITVAKAWHGGTGHRVSIS